MKPHINSTILKKGIVHKPRKRFGQNFLHDQSVINRIIEAINPCLNDRLVEIGPGQGALTEPLAATGALLDCIELDRDLAKYLRQHYAENSQVTVYEKDGLKFDFAELAPARGSLRIVGNLPYNTSTPMLFHLMKYQELIKDMTFMLQLEVVQRMTAKPGNKNYGRLGLMLQYFCEIEHLFNVPSAAFSPKPKVVSALARLTPHSQLPIVAKDVNCLQIVIRTAFNQRRKTLKNSLKSIVSEETLNKLPLDGSLRPENLNLRDYVIISDAISNQ